MTDDPKAPPPLPKAPTASKHGFSAAAGRGNARLGPFTETQILQLHRLHAEMQQENKLSELTFDYGHNFCRASFLLVTPLHTDKALVIRLSENREHDGTYTYVLNSLVDGASHSSDIISRKVKDRSQVPGFAMDSLRAMLISMNAHDFSDLTLSSGGGVTHLNAWRRAHANGGLDHGKK